MHTKPQSRFDLDCGLIPDSTREGYASSFTQVVGRFQLVTVVGLRDLVSCCGLEMPSAPRGLTTWGSPTWPLGPSKPARERTNNSSKTGIRVYKNPIIVYILSYLTYLLVHVFRYVYRGEPAVGYFR